MNNKKISSIQFSILLVFPILALFNGVGFHNLMNTSGVDAYISVMVSFVLGLFILWLFMYILNYKEEMSILKKNTYIFGKVFGMLMNFLICGLLVVVGIALTYSISNFIVSQFLAETPVYIILVLLGLIVIYNVSKGIETIARGAVIFFLITTLLTIISTLGVMPHFDSSNLKPILENGMAKPIEASFTLMLTNIVPVLVLLIIPKEKIINKQKVGKYVHITYFIAMLYLFLATILTVGSLGIHLLKIFPHPEYIVLKKISILGFISRIENFIYIKWLLNNFVCFSLITYFISNFFVEKTKQKLLPFLIVSLVFILSGVLFKNNTSFKLFVRNLYPYFNLALLGLFIVTAIGITVKKRTET